MPDKTSEMPTAATPQQMAALTENLTQATILAQQAWTRYIETHGTGADAGKLDPFNITPAYAELAQAMLEHPEKVTASIIDFWSSYAELWQNSWLRAMGAAPKSDDKPVDKRFKDPAWSENFAFDHLRQTYMLASNWIMNSVQDAEGLDPQDRHKVEFFTKRFIEAASPANFMGTNPEVLKVTMEEKGENLVRGMKRLLADLDRGKGELWISQTDMQAFTVGENIATAPGKVIFENDLIQLIQYSPSTDEVYTRPLLITPPWINKFYIMDLEPKKSMVRWLVDQGYTLFMVSWRNPEPGSKAWTFEDYIEHGLFAAIDAVLSETGQKKLNIAGYCIGGTLLASAMALMARRGDQRIASATFFTAQTDFELAGDLKVFIDDETMKRIEETAEAEGGVLGAQHMAQAFNMLRGSDLIWNFVVNNYYMGKDPFPFDMLYWNADSTRMPARCHLFYMRNFYHENRLARGELTLFGETLDLGDIKTPVYSVCAREDHIAPPESVYRGMKLMGGSVRFVTGGSGHIAGIINHPSRNKYQHWISAQPRTKWPESFDEFIAGATEHPGSWWGDWDKWLSKKSGSKIEAREPGATLGTLEDAPGSYVKARSDLD